ncbi:MAG: methyltransferase domain-containing protein [Magnetococcales bacterium]|nr:methyltransferase domain-containing protein [Magnetococcales bacterium]
MKNQKNNLWGDYSQVYDFMAYHNSEYQEIIEIIFRTIKNLGIPNKARILDIGAGTGNFSIRIAESYKSCQIVHLEPDSKMIEIAKIKAYHKGLNNINFINSSFANEIELEDFDLILCIHALYTFPFPKTSLLDINRITNKDGKFIICDIGRVLDLLDWSLFLFKDNIKRNGIFSTLSNTLKSFKLAFNNRIIRNNQKRGVYWVHSHSELKSSLINAGFNILHDSIVYRGYSDFFVCEKK